MKYLFLGFSPLETTLIVFSIILLCFIFIPLHYNMMEKGSLKSIQCKSLFLDWHFLLPCLVYTILLGYRWNYYYDWMQYHDDFVYIDRYDIVRDNTESGYLLVNKVLSMLGFDFYSIFLLEGFIYIFSIYYVFKENRSMLLFVLPIVFIEHRTGLNISRQYFAMSIMLIAFAKLMDGKRLSFLIIAVMASSIHMASFLWIIPFYFFKSIKIPPMWVTFLFYFVTILLMPVIQNILATTAGFVQNNFLSDKAYTTQFIMEYRFLRDISTYRIFVNACKDMVYILLAYYYKKCNEHDNKLYVIISMGLYAMFLRNLAGPHEIFSRFFYYITIFTSMGMGILFFLAYKDYKRLPSYYIIGVFIVCLQTVYSLYAGIIDSAKNTLTNTMIIYK